MSVNTKMTALADEIRTLSGTLGTMGLDAMASNVNNANTEIDSQEDLIEQIVTALENKACNSVEDLSEEIGICNGHLDELEEIIETLPDTDNGGSGGMAVATCDVTITSNDFTTIVYTQFVDGQLTCQYSSYNVQHSLTNVMCGTAIAVADLRIAVPYSLTINNAEKIHEVQSAQQQIWVFKAVSSGTASINISAGDYE